MGERNTQPGNVDLRGLGSFPDITELESQSHVSRVRQSPKFAKLSFPREMPPHFIGRELRPSTIEEHGRDSQVGLGARPLGCSKGALALFSSTCRSDGNHSVQAAGVADVIRILSAGECAPGGPISPWPWPTPKPPWRPFPASREACSHHPLRSDTNGLSWVSLSIPRWSRSGNTSPSNSRASGKGQCLQTGKIGTFPWTQKHAWNSINGGITTPA